MNKEVSAFPVLHKLYKEDKLHAYNDIKKAYQENWYGIISFLYFANAMKYRLFEDANNEKSVQYKQTLLQSDFLLPDGIALERFYTISSRFNKKLERKKLHNLNWTDFIPYFIHSLLKESKDIHIGIYSTYDPIINKTLKEIEKAKSNFHRQYGIEVAFSHAHNYRQTEASQLFPFQKYADSIKKESKKYNILLVCTWTPKQELRSHQHKDFFKENNVLVYNAGWFVDFLSWFEKRAPKRVVKAKVLETFWRITKNPQKNLKKFLVMFGIFRFLGKKIHYQVCKLRLKK